METSKVEEKIATTVLIIFFCVMVYFATVFTETVSMRKEFNSVCDEVASISKSDKETVKQEINNIIAKYNMEDSDITLLYDNASKKEYVYIDYIQSRGKQSFHRTKLIDLKNTK